MPLIAGHALLLIEEAVIKEIKKLGSSLLVVL